MNARRTHADALVLAVFESILRGTRDVTVHDMAKIVNVLPDLLNTRFRVHLKLVGADSNSSSTTVNIPVRPMSLRGGGLN